MANDQGMSLGLFPLNAPYGNLKISYYRAATTQALYRFQPVVVDGRGLVVPAIIGDLLPIMGSIVGFLDAGDFSTLGAKYNASGKSSIPSGMTSLSQGAYLPAGKEAFVAVTDDPDQEYLIEADTGGGTLPDSESIMCTANYVYEATTGSTATGIANTRLDISDIAADTGGMLYILRPHDNINTDGTINTVSAAYTKWVVKITQPQAGQLRLTANT